MFFVYVLQCSDQTYYIGSTKNLEKRLVQHNAHKAGARYTKMRRPVVLKYSESFPTLHEARRREAEIKKWKRPQKEHLFKIN
ncbi:MAG: GIY-YIG nuclease family protein [Candidatus Levybacteria bacterium]|nr:GIY-YIG nuclease family protein [Candidatus Levybacteria bacterium]